MTTSPLTEVIFEGVKTFWKTKSSLDVLIIHHHFWDAIEVLAFDPAIDCQAPRIYLSYSDILAKIHSKKHKYSLDFSMFYVDKVQQKHDVSSFLFNHLTIEEYLPVTRSFTVAIRSSFPEEGYSELSIICDKPVGLVPFPSPFYSPLR